MGDTRPIVIDGLAGVDQRWSARAPSATTILDMWRDPRGGWQSAGGYKRIILGHTQEGVHVNPFRNSGAIESIHWFAQHTGGRRWLVYIDGSGGLYTFNPPTGARSGSPGDAAKDRAGNTITRTVVTTPWQRSQSAAWGDQLYLVNGIDRPLVFNGYWWDYAGWAQPAGVPSAVAMAHPHASDEGSSPSIPMPNTGLGPIDTADTDAVNYTCAYRYRMSFVNDRGAESPLSEPSEVVYFVNPGGDTSPGQAPHFVKLSAPLGPASCVSRRLYRTQNLYDSTNTLITGYDQVYYFCQDIDDNTTTLLMDGLPDGYLGSKVDPDQFGAWPLNAAILKPFRGRMYAAGIGTANIAYSRRGNPEEWPPNNVLSVGGDTLGPVTGMYATRNALVVFKARKVYLVKDDGVNEPTAEPLDGTIGCIAANTIAEVPGVGVCFLSDSGIGVLQGTLQNEGVPTVILNSAVALPDVFARVNRAAMINACSAVYHRDKEWWLAIPMIGHADNWLVCVYHYEIREWTFRLNYPIASMLETPDAAGNLLFASYAASAGASPDGVAHLGVFVYSRSAADKDGTAITPVYETNQISIASQYRSFRPSYVLVSGILHGNNKLTLNVNSNYSLTPWYATAASVIQQYPQDKVPVYGTATFDSGKEWQNWRPGTMRFDLSKPLAAPVLAMTVRLEPEAGTRYMTLMGMSIEVAPDDPVAVKPLKPDAS